jgi:hypothetical protein
MNILFWVSWNYIEEWDKDFEKNVGRAIDLWKKEWKLLVGDRILVVNDLRRRGKEVPIVELFEIE